MTAARLSAALFAALVLAPTVQARTDAPKPTAPEGLRAFLLRADEPKNDVYPRTPSFAWRPVPRAVRYEFQLSTSNLFRDSGVVYRDLRVETPAIAIPVALPWITGKPYALYARVRAVTQTGTTPWTKAYGFNMRWPTVPEPMSSFPGLLRWTPVAGATRYQVWFGEAKKVITTATNVADEREYYTFHSDSTWTSSVSWRVRAVREVYGSTGNALPAVSYGPWSPVYTAVNPPFETTAFGLTASVSDAVTDATEAKDAHTLMPGFAFSGVTSGFGTTRELYRMYAFTDGDCVNAVFRGSVVGSPAYAPRISGMLKLPHTLGEIERARNRFLRDLGEDEPAEELSMDGAEVVPNENAKPASEEGPASAGDAEPEAGATAAAGESAAGELTIPPVDLWDTEWPQGGYYWTVVGVEAVQPDPFETTLAVSAAVGETTLELDDGVGLAVGDKLDVGSEVVTVKAISGTSVTLETELTEAHAAGEDVKRPADTIRYQDAELPQDACAGGRVLRFGKMSEPAVAVAGSPLISGLSTSGRLISATPTAAVFYGAPVVAWNPAAGAHAYEVEWSKRAEPFARAAKPVRTYSTSVVLPLRPGTWHYRVRGLNLTLPKGAQPLSWSDPVKVVVARPRFKIVSK